MEDTVLLLTMMSMMITAGVCSVIFNKLKLTPIIGYLLAGILIVNIFNLEENSHFDMEIVEVLKGIGLVILMFGIGTELNITKIRRCGKFAMLVAIIQLPLMVLSGYAFGILLFNLNTTAAITLGAVISGSSTAVVSAVLQSQKRISKEVGETIILVTIIEDIGQVLILSMVAPLFVGGDVEAVEIVKLIILIIVFMLSALSIGIFLVPRALDWVGNNTSAEVLLVLAVGLCFFMAWVSVYIGMSMAIGAFLMGVIVSQSKFSEEISREMKPMTDVFMAVFFISIGMEVTFQGFVNNLPMAIGIFFLFAISKFFTVFLGYFVGNKEPKEGFIASVSLIAMGEFAFIISNEAYKSGAVTIDFYTAVIGGALISIIVLPIISKGMFKSISTIHDKCPGCIARLGGRILDVRNDIYCKINESPGIEYYAKKNLKKTYVCMILIILIEIAFSGLMESMTEFLAELIYTDLMDSHHVAYIILMVVNFFMLVIPTYALIKSIKTLDKTLIEGSSRMGMGFSSESSKRLESFYKRLLNFSTVALIFTIDFTIMAIVPGPFGAEKSSLIVIPIAIVIFIIGLILSKKEKGQTKEQTLEEDE